MKEENRGWFVITANIMWQENGSRVSYNLMKIPQNSEYTSMPALHGWYQLIRLGLNIGCENLKAFEGV